jgi:thiamine biosynthesis lipoprotein
LPTRAPTAAPIAVAPIAVETGKRIELHGEAMGTRITLASYTDSAHDEASLRQTIQAAFNEIVRLESIMSPWRPQSELARVNAAAGTRAVIVGAEMLAVAGKSRWISERSGGVFDVTFASMGKLWRFNHDLVKEVPDKKDIDRARTRIDYRRLKIDHEKSTLFIERADQTIDFGGIAKGYAVDRAAAILRTAGLTAFFVQAGGDLYIAGRKPDGEPMRVGVRDPRGPDGSFFARLPVEDHAFSTAGDYERAFIKDGKRYHHIIDPRTGFPATLNRSVTIWAKDAFTADAIDDAVFILGPEQGLALVESIDDCGAVIVDAANKVWVSKRLAPLVEKLREPSNGI